jgi:xenotropic and polytropic retrovirus receptor 1
LRALKEFNRTPTSTSFRNPVYESTPRGGLSGIFGGNRTQAESRDATDVAPDVNPENGTQHRPPIRRSPVITIKREQEPLVGSSRNEITPMVRYGSIIGSPPSGSSAPSSARPPSLRLPDPAMNSAPEHVKRRKISTVPEEDGGIGGGSAYEAGKTKTPTRANKFRSRSMFVPRAPGVDQSHFRRLLSIGVKTPSPGLPLDFRMDSYRQVELAQSEFFSFLDDELEKIESFYKEKEDEATERLGVLREQLHVLRDRRLQDLLKARELESRQRSSRGSESDLEHTKSRKWNVFLSIDHVWNTVRNGKIGRKSIIMEEEATPITTAHEHRRDYVRRRTDTAIPYRSARRKLKLALLEYYRGLELLKSYAMLNRKAFRKINKKYDKIFTSRPSGRYVTEKVNNAWFVNSDVIDSHIQSVEDLYARYFEAGNHKVAASKLRKSTEAREYYGGAMFRNGLSLAAGIILGAQGIAAAANLLFHGSPDVSSETSYLLQVSRQRATGTTKTNVSVRYTEGTS